MIHLERARAGDDRAFGELIEPYRRELRVHCYRMLGSLTDAEDVLQESLLAAWRGLDGFEGRASPRTWLYRIVTNRCLNAIRDGARRPPVVPVPLFEPPEPSRRDPVTWLQPYPDELLDPAESWARRETVELAFVAALQTLPPRQTATLLLRDVLGYSAAETAAMLDTTATAVKGMLQRARAAMVEPSPPAGDERELAGRFAAAFVDRDLNQLLDLLTDDAWLAMPPAPHVYAGRAAIAGFLSVSTTWRPDITVRMEPVAVNRQPAYTCFLNDQPAGIMVPATGPDGITGITRFLPAHVVLNRT